MPLFLIELYGFHGTLRVGAVLNAAIATAALAVTLASGPYRAEQLATEPLPSCKVGTAEDHPDPFLYHGPGHDGHGSRLDPPIHAVPWPYGLFLRYHFGVLSAGHLYRLAGLPPLEPPPATTRTGSPGFRWRYLGCCRF